MYRGTTLDNHHTDPGNLDYTTLFEDADVAFKWGVTPDKFYELPPVIRAIMIQYVRSNNRLDAIVHYEQSQADRANRKH